MEGSKTSSDLFNRGFFLKRNNDLPMSVGGRGTTFKLAFDPLAGQGEVGSEFMSGDSN